MATAYTMTRDTIIAYALRRIGVVAVGETPSANLVTEAAALLNILVKELDIEPWLSNKITASALSVAVSANAATASLDTDALTVEGAYFLPNSGSRIPLKPMSLRDKIEATGDSTAATTQIFYSVSRDHLSTNLTMYLYPVIPSAGNIYYFAKKKLDIFDNASDTGDLPPYFYRYLVFQLAVDLAFGLGKGLEDIDRLAAQADRCYQKLAAWEGREVKQHLSDQPSTRQDAVL